MPPASPSPWMAERPAPRLQLSLIRIGQGRPQIHRLDVGDIAEVAGVVVLRHLDAKP